MSKAIVIASFRTRAGRRFAIAYLKRWWDAIAKTSAAQLLIEIERVIEANAEITALIDELDQELSRQYPPETQHAIELDEIRQPHILFFAARLNGSAVGCGGLALFSGFSEVKRLYVREEARGRGVADAIMSRLIEEALAARRTTMRLETGTRSFAAIRFYQRWGFQPCEIYEPYASMPPQAIAASLFFERKAQVQ